MTNTIFWLVAVIVFGVAEVITLGLTTIWFAIGALIALLCSGLGLPTWFQILIFIVVSLIMILFTRPIAMKYFNRNREKTNVDSMLGKKAIVIEKIDNLHASGRVTVSGQEWMARSELDSELIEEGAVTLIIAVSGVKLIVRQVDQRMSAQ